MSSDERQFLPADPEPHPREEIREIPTLGYAEGYPADPYRAELDPDHPLPPDVSTSRSLFRHAEVAEPFRPRFPASWAWAALYFLVSLFVCIFFWIFGQLIPAIVAIIGLIVWKCVQVGAQQALAPANMQALQDESMAPTLIAGHIAAVSLALIFLRLLLGPDWRSRLAMRLPGLWHFFLTLLMVPTLLVLASGVFALTKRFLPNLGDLTGLPMPGMEKMVEIFGTWPWWLGVLVVGLGPALGEELWCRGLIGLGLMGRNGVVARVLVTSFYFGLLHIDPQQGTMAAFMGLVLHFVMLTTRCFWMPVLIHFCNNSVSVIAARFEDVKDLDQKPEAFPLFLYLGAFILFSTLVWSLLRTRARLMNAGENTALWHPVYAGQEYPPANSGVWIMRPRPGLVDALLIAFGVAAFGAAIAATILLAKPA